MLNLPSPPTDNLYKFISIFGLVLVVISIFYSETKTLEVNQEMYNLKREKSTFEIEKSKIQRKQKFIKEKMEDLNKHADIKSKPVVNDSIISWIRITSGSENLVSESNTISALIEDLRVLEIELEKKEVEISSKDSIVELELEQYDRIIILIKVLVPVGIFLSCFGFLLWYDKSQKYQDVILKDQFLQAQKQKRCQSCGMSLKLDKLFINKSEEEKKKVDYCGHCYVNNHFTEPDLTYDGMVAKVKNRLIEVGANKIEIFLYLKMIKDLDRWRRKFTWE